MGHIKIYKSQTIRNSRIIEISTIAQVSSKTTEQINKRTHSTQVVKLS